MVAFLTISLSEIVSYLILNNICSPTFKFQMMHRAEIVVWYFCFDKMKLLLMFIGETEWFSNDCVPCWCILNSIFPPFFVSKVLCLVY